MFDSLIKKIVISVFVIGFLLVVSSLFVSIKKNGVSEQLEKNVQIQTEDSYFLDSSPKNGDVYAARPINVTVNFNSDLVVGSNISVKSDDGFEWTEDSVQIEDNNTALQKKLKQGIPDGNFKVNYISCWADGICNEGTFFFEIDSSKKSSYLDLRGKDSLVIKMENFKFEQDKIIISPGTKIVWKNYDEVGHFVNTETHPEHTYFPKQNSKEIVNGEEFTTVFEELGQYDYHCSAHVPEGMRGSIIVSGD